ncbi:MAG: UDPglucose--hexose-phosphate uridylyltransferase, partial [Candidatus Sumerlaeota bacterium]|nr:UDPglucose--hexose-phosphate uridylyltransferase [Candidatus Sumerlaeota bacterium]
MTFDHPHLRRNPLTGETVLVSPHRLNRPWQGKQETIPSENKPAYDAGCYLCPGNARAGGEKNPEYENTFVFDNDFSALLMDGGKETPSTHELLQANSIQGMCRVICFSPRHDLTLAEMPASAILTVVETWAEQFQLLGSKPEIAYVQIFENKGMIMGCSNPHPHGQIWATSEIPHEPAREDAAQRTWWERHRRTLLEDYLSEELRRGERIVCQNDHWAALV